MPQPPQAIYKLQDHHWWWLGLRDLYSAALRRYLLPGRKRIIKIGCGYGANLPLMSTFGDVVGLDISLASLRSISPQPSLGLVQARAEALPFKKDTFDTVCLLAVIEHVADDQTVMNETYRVARHGAIQLVLTSAFMLLWSHHDRANGHCRRYRTAQINALQVQSGWHPLHTSYVNASIFPVAVIIRFMQRWLDTGKNDRYDMGPDLAPLNYVMKLLLSLETNLIIDQQIKLPFGVDIFSVARRDD
jgi:ubiquinone/menaquinone biosynthesis C-methylase UbiE